MDSYCTKKRCKVGAVLSLRPWRIYKHDASRHVESQVPSAAGEREERQGIRGNLGGEDWSFAGLEHATQQLR